jgi:psiF repeat
MHALLGALTSILLVAALASAADDKTGHTSQTHRMTECNAQAGGQHLTGEARRQFMSECLKGHAATREGTPGGEKGSHSGADGEHHTTPQGEKMKACNRDASGKNLHGDERKAFMSQCLKAGKSS